MCLSFPVSRYLTGCVMNSSGMELEYAYRFTCKLITFLQRVHYSSLRVRFFVRFFLGTKINQYTNYDFKTKKIFTINSSQSKTSTYKPCFRSMVYRVSTDFLLSPRHSIVKISEPFQEFVPSNKYLLNAFSFSWHFLAAVMYVVY